MQRKQIAEKGKFIGQTIEIVGGLRASLDKEHGGDVAANLESLYEYIGRQLVVANLKNSEQILDEISGLLTDVKTAWDAINAPAVVDDSKSVSPVVVDNKPVEAVEKVIVNKPVIPVNARANRALKAYSA